MRGRRARARRVIDRFDGRILGVGSTSGVRAVVGDWVESPLGAFTDVMVATADHRRVLLAPSSEVAAYVSATYSFDEVVETTVVLTEAEGPKGEPTWTVEAGPLRLAVTLGDRTTVGWLLRAVPTPFARSRPGALLADPVARRVYPGVRTYGSAGNGRREYYGALDQHRVVAAAGTWSGEPLGELAEVVPVPRFGFSSTPSAPALTRVVTTVVRAPASEPPS